MRLQRMNRTANLMTAWNSMFDLFENALFGTFRICPRFVVRWFVCDRLFIFVEADLFARAVLLNLN